MELQEALAQIAEIRRYVARGEVFRGYRALPVLFSGLLAFAAAGMQIVWISEPAQNPTTFLILWITTAILSVAAIGAEIAWRLQRPGSALERQRVGLAAGQFLPALLAGALIMFALLRY